MNVSGLLGLVLFSLFLAPLLISYKRQQKNRQEYLRIAQQRYLEHHTQAGAKTE